MSVELFRYHEPLDAEELAFLLKRANTERSQFYKLMRIMMIVSFILPFIIAWGRALGGAKDPFSMIWYFLGVLFLMSFSALVLYLVYRSNLYKVDADIHRRTKTIERTHITRKQFMPQNNTYYFYLDSEVKLSIEVNEYDFNQFQKGDEINIEYTTEAKYYLGYF